MKRIKLTHGKTAIVDDNTYKQLRSFKWFAVKNSSTEKWYAARSENGRRISMHRQILNAPRGVQVDHANGNGLDNRKSNIRFATSAQNNRNRDKTKRNSTGYKGVSRQQGRRKFRAQIQVDGDAIYLGWYDNPRDAALAYDRAARQYHGEFGCTNF